MSNYSIQNKFYVEQRTTFFRIIFFIEPLSLCRSTFFRINVVSIHSLQNTFLSNHCLQNKFYVDPLALEYILCRTTVFRINFMSNNEQLSLE